MKFNQHAISEPSGHTLAPIVQQAIFLLSLATFSSMASQRVCDAMLPELSRVFDAPVGDVARVISYFAITYGLMQLVYGPIGERWGKYRVVQWALVGCGLGCALSALSGQLELLVLARILTAAAAAAIIPLSMAWVGDAVHYSVRQETLARLGLGTMLGIACGQLFGGLMSDTFGWRWAFGVLAMLFGGVAVLLARHAPQVHPQASAATARASFFRQLAEVASNGWARTLLSIALVEGAMVFGAMAIAATHLHQAYGVSLTTAGTIAALFGVGGMLYMASAKYAIRRLGEAGLARWGGTLMGLSLLLLGLTPWWPLAAPACLIAGFSFAMFHNTIQAKATQMVPSARATGMTMFAGFLFWGQSLGVLVLAHGMNVMPSGHVIALAALVVIALGWLFGHTISRRNATHADHA